MTPLVSTNNNQFGDTTYTKVFVGGLPWETQKDTMKEYFEQFGDILEAVVISDKSTGRSKGYGFVTFRQAESAMKACADPSPVIDGRRANCNLAAFATQKSKPSSPNKQGVVVERSMNTNPIHKVGMGAAFACATTFPHHPHALQHRIPYNVVGYSQDYAYPTNYYGLNGGVMAGQYPVYGTAIPNVGMTTGFTRASANATPYYPYVQYPTGGGYGHYAYHSHQQQHHHLVPYLGTNSTIGIYAYQPYAYAPPVSVALSSANTSSLNMMALAAPIPHH